MSNLGFEPMASILMNQHPTYGYYRISKVLFLWTWNNFLKIFSKQYGYLPLFLRPNQRLSVEKPDLLMVIEIKLSLTLLCQKKKKKYEIKAANRDGLGAFSFAIDDEIVKRDLNNKKP